MSGAAVDESWLQADARVGRTLKDKWTLDRLLGVGGMAAVYAATHRNQKRVAIKMLHPELSFNANVRQRFLREGYVANTVQHPGAVTVDDDDVSEDGLAFLVMELLDGETLEARWERKGKRLPTGEVLALMDRVLDTLAAAHARGIVHRDLKPENLFFTRDAQVKVLDFGIARVRELGSTTKTQTGSLMGTPSFMSPEQARGRWEEVDAQSDLWALGATMFTLLTGDLVHVAGTVNEALALAVTQPARSLGLVRPELPSSVIAFVDRALAYDKQARWADALAMQTALREAYASLEGEWDERTVLNEAAASLPEAQVAAPTASAAGTTALATSKSAPVLPLPIRNRSMLLIATAVLGLVLLVIVIGSIATTSSSVPAAESSHAAALPPTASQKPRSAALASEAPSLPPLAVEDLPAVESIPPRASVAPSSSRGAVAPGTAAIVRSAQVVAPPSPAPQRAPSRALADPFAGRD